jgi:hypothetical protein
VAKRPERRADCWCIEYMRLELLYLPAVILCGSETCSVILRGGSWAGGVRAEDAEGVFGSEGSR